MKKICSYVLMLCFVVGIVPTLASNLPENNLLGFIRPNSVNTTLNNNDAYKLIDNDMRSVWQVPFSDTIGSLSFDMGGATVKTIWVRNGNYSSLETYKATGRLNAVEIRLRMQDGSSVNRLFSVYDIYAPRTLIPSIKNGYQNLDMGTAYSNVTQLDIIPMGITRGTINNYVAISDIAFSDGSTVESYFETATPIPSTPTPQATQVPAVTANIGGVRAVLKERLASRSGPGTQYEGTGAYENKGEEVLVLARGWDTRNKLWWVQVEFEFRGKLRRLYTGIQRFDINPEELPEEKVLHEYAVVKQKALGFYGPGKDYSARKIEIEAGTEGRIYAIENGYVHFEYEREPKKLRRVWLDAAKVRIP